MRVNVPLIISYSCDLFVLIARPSECQNLLEIECCENVFIRKNTVILLLMYHVTKDAILKKAILK